MATQKDERTPLRAIQPEIVHGQEDKVEGLVFEEKLTEFGGGSLDEDEVDENEAPLQAGPEIQLSASPKRTGMAMSRATARRPRNTAAVRRSLLLRTSMRASMSAAGGAPGAGEQFQREVFDVHSEIDKLLGGLKGELEEWRSDFQSLQVWFFSQVMCVEYPEGGAGLRSLSEFQALLQRFLDENEFDLQDLEARLKSSEEDRAELQDLLQEGSAAVNDLEAELEAERKEKKEFGKKVKEAEREKKWHSEELQKIAEELKEAQNELGAKEKELEREKQLEREKRGFEEEKVERDRKKAEHEKKRLEEELERAGHEKETLRKAAEKEAEMYEQQIQQVRKEFSGISESNAEIQVEVKRLLLALEARTNELEAERVAHKKAMEAAASLAASQAVKQQKEIDDLKKDKDGLKEKVLGLFDL
ncbi:hypothetical protein HOP50_03g23580 [Chloropicon primus]|uniref:Uncharacterized protein n=1 Tax=Chloropicon primus TaxID=1764295 RepID=A0A5B8MKE7_9CHLO|nr:hypothetical protein A3770_03p23600 [Chloropicon primus]UPQ99052.1 hypothetical protein HOP50_03g23580 [Chloropicon primus]|eukprot:QDZ19842.1 hypothetical protein A3770_03p23600 [Chloropicon primus]